MNDFVVELLPQTEQLFEVRLAFLGGEIMVNNA